MDLRDSSEADKELLKNMSEKVEGLFHVHSNYSYDGVSSLSELVGFCEDRGYGFIILTEHAEDFNGSKMQTYITECERSSTERILLIPGLEFGFDEYPDLHLLGVGIKEYISPQDITAVIEKIQNQKGLAIIAHPSRNNYFIPSKIINKLDGLEIWNVAYDSRYLPNFKALRLYGRLKKENGALIAFSGLDMHAINNFREVTLVVNGIQGSNKDLLNRLRKGQFINKGKMIKFQAELKMAFYSQIMILIGHFFLDMADYVYWTMFKLRKVFQG